MRRLLLWMVVLAAVAQAQDNEFGGPSILSRGLGAVLVGGGELARLRPYVSLYGFYDTALTPAALDPGGVIPENESYGGDLTFGVNGFHRWRRSLLGINYRGGVRRYVDYSRYNGSDHSLSLALAHQPSRSVVVTLRQAAGTHSRSYGWFTGTELFDLDFAQIPRNELFDARTNFLSTMGDLTWNKSPRFSVNLGGSHLIVRRSTSGLIGVDGWTARGDVAYRLSRRVTMGVDYGFTHYTFSDAFGASDIHSTAADFSIQLGRRWHLSLRAGGARTETLGLHRVDVDPIIAAIIGRTTGIEAFYRVQYLPSFSGSLSRVVRRTVLSVNYQDAPSAGNGIYLLSRARGGGINFSYTATRRLNFGLSADFNSYRSLTQTIGDYTSYSGVAGLNYLLGRGIHLSLNYGARTYDISGGLLHRFSHRGSVGIAYSPGDSPLSTW